MTIQRKIRFVRTQKDLSQTYMASKTNMSQSKYNKLETGKIKISIDNFHQICNVLEIPMDDLYNLKLELFSNKYLQNPCNTNIEIEQTVPQKKRVTTTSKSSTSTE